MKYPRVGISRATSVGFSLIEALATMAITAVLVALAAPVLSDFLDRQRVRADNQFGLKALTMARAQAMVVEEASTFVCWNAGAAVLRVADPDTEYFLQSGELIVVEGSDGDFDDAVTRGFIRTEESVALDNDADNCIGFDAQGRITGHPGGAVFAMTFCRGAGDAQDSRRLEVNPAGRVSIKLNTDTTGAGTQACS